MLEINRPWQAFNENSRLIQFLWHGEIIEHNMWIAVYLGLKYMFILKPACVALHIIHGNDKTFSPGRKHIEITQMHGFIYPVHIPHYLCK